MARQSRAEAVPTGWNAPGFRDQVAKLIAVLDSSIDTEALSALDVARRRLSSQKLKFVDLAQLVRNAPAADEFDLGEHRASLAPLFEWLLNEIKLRGYAVSSDEAEDLLALDHASGQSIGARELAEAFALYTAVRRKAGR